MNAFPQLELFKFVLVSFQQDIMITSAPQPISAPSTRTVARAASRVAFANATKLKGPNVVSRHFYVKNPENGGFSD